MSEPSYKILEIAQFPKYKVLASYFTNVKNTDEIKSNLLKGNKAYDFAFINGENILSTEQIYSAIYKCLLDDNFNRLKAKTLHTEIIFDLAPQRNIMECLNKFGISTASSNLIVLKVLKTDKSQDFNEIFEGLKSNVDGDVLEFDDSTLDTFADLTAIKENYKLGDAFTEDKPRLNRMLVNVTQLKGI